MGSRLRRIWTMGTSGPRNALSIVREFEQHHRLEWIIALILAIACAFAIEPVRTRWLNYERDKVTRHVLDATAILVARDRNNHRTAVGMGVFISPDGLLITNRHIVTNGGLEARLRNGAFYELRSEPGAIRSYRDYDFSILHFDGEGIPYVDLGNSATLTARERILTLIPQPTSAPTLASGLVSQPNLPVGPPINWLIEITTSITPSIPNGGLFDDGGHVLGLISNLVVPAEFRKNVSTLYAIPIDRLKPVITGREKQAQADNADSLYSLGILAENRKKIDEATHYFQQAIAVDPHYANAYWELGGIDYDNGDFDGQLNMYQKAAQYAPRNTDILYYLGNAYEDKGLYDEAIDEYLRVLELKPDHKDALYQLGILYMMRGDKAKTSEYVAKLERLDPGAAAELKVILSRMR